MGGSALRSEAEAHGSSDHIRPSQTLSGRYDFWRIQEHGTRPRICRSPGGDVDERSLRVQVSTRHPGRDCRSRFPGVLHASFHSPPQRSIETVGGIGRMESLPWALLTVPIAETPLAKIMAVERHHRHSYALWHLCFVLLLSSFGAWQFL